MTLSLRLMPLCNAVAIPGRPTIAQTHHTDRLPPLCFHVLPPFCFPCFFHVPIGTLIIGDRAPLLSPADTPLPSYPPCFVARPSLTALMRWGERSPSSPYPKKHSNRFTTPRLSIPPTDAFAVLALLVHTGCHATSHHIDGHIERNASSRMHHPSCMHRHVMAPSPLCPSLQTPFPSLYPESQG